MGEFFKSWRRKAGCVTLVMACLFMAGWVRSKLKYDLIVLPCGNSSYRVALMFGRFRFLRATPSALPPSWVSKDVSHISYQEAEEWFVDMDGERMEWKNMTVEWQWSWGMFSFGAGTRLHERVELYTFPYWSVVIPLTLLSAYLILWKPRKRDPQPKQI